MKELKGTKTEKNLWTAFAGESQARNKYTYFASKAKKEGYEQIAAIFQETADNEKEHAKMWFKLLGGIGSTAENLVAAAAGEHEEWDILYAEFAKVADEEGFAEVAETFRQIAKVEAEHERRYLKLLERVTDGTVFIRDNEIWWQCRNCGYILLAKEAPIKCPACAHPQAFFEPKKENY